MGGLHRDTLFGVFAALARGDTWSFPALRSHQREPWHAFVVQCAAMALIRAGIDDPPGDEVAWRDLLIGLTPDQPDGSAWDLVVDDWTRPALLQPPVVAAANRVDYRGRLATPDALDMLVTAKNHDVKQERMAGAAPEDWLFALVTLQTIEGYLGAGNFGVSRMNGGFATRMSLGIRPAGGAAGAFRRDVRRLLADAQARPDRRGGTALLWTVPWDGTRSLAITDLDELYVEICRRVRLRPGAAGIEAAAAGSKCARVAAADLKGKTGDPWAPIKADQSASHTPTGAGFGYRQMTSLLDRQKIEPPLLAQTHASDDRTGLALVAAALVRGQGKTEGLHRRIVRISRIEEIDALSDREVLDRIGEVARTRSADAGDAGRWLRRALMVLIQGGPETPRLDDDSSARKADPWMRRFDALVDREFFGAPLWAEAAGTPGPHRQEWCTRLRALARTILDEAARSAPRTEMRRVRAIARSRGRFDAEMAKWLKEVA